MPSVAVRKAANHHLCSKVSVVKIAISTDEYHDWLELYHWDWESDRNLGANLKNTIFVV